MTQKEREKAEQYLYIVGWVLNKYQLYNNTNPNMGYDDLYQEGCIALCKAVQRFDAAKGSHMNAFAFTVVRNHIFAYCKKISMKRRTMSLSELTETKSLFPPSWPSVLHIKGNTTLFLRPNT